MSEALERPLGQSQLHRQDSNSERNLWSGRPTGAVTLGQGPQPARLGHGSSKNPADWTQWEGRRQESLWTVPVGQPSGAEQVKIGEASSCGDGDEW